ncbi:hypothetical protein LPJ73_000050 [Coemansia sp. RSA 2703]|nr:hypothetical protein LPJ73_000050 [Coemansia sp. RSA 2703]KAJ2379404.1 hypothetical protein IW150_000197 [Coemansia sp. RSA 2607]KAJ2398430.1 hypothetical protein GGI05_000091 [Coemansia sp. RSA 2603]
MMFEDAINYGIDLNAILAQELGGLAVAPTPVSVSAPPPNVLVNRVPDGFTPILINLQRCSRAELRRFLHSMLCTPVPGENGTAPKERPLGRCGCELLEFDYQPDFLFNKRKHGALEEAEEDGYSSCSEAGELDSPARDSQGYISNSDDGIIADNDSDDAEETERAQEAERNRIKIKRPPNSFMIYRSKRHNELVKEYRGGNKVISGIIAKEWHSMRPEIRKKYEDMAAVKKREHEMLYPNYKFMPKRRKH